MNDQMCVYVRCVHCSERGDSGGLDMFTDEMMEDVQKINSVLKLLLLFVQLVIQSCVLKLYPNMIFLL